MTSRATASITIKGKGLSQGISLSMENNEYFYVTRNSFSASEINNGISIVIGFTAEEVGEFSDIVTLSNDEVTTSFTITATATKQGETPDPPVVLGDSITEDWEGCKTGGYWTNQVQGHAWKWDFVDAGIWGDNLSHGELSCRFGKTNGSAITMAEDVEGGTSAIEFWAASYGNDSDATLLVDFSTNKGGSWIRLGSITVTRGALQQVIMDVPLKNNARFRIVQQSGMRVNIDDITIYGRSQEPIDIPGDANGDGEVNILDINFIVNVILGDDTSDSSIKSADVNRDGEVNIADINLTLNAIITL